MEIKSMPIEATSKKIGVKLTPEVFSQLVLRKGYASMIKRYVPDDYKCRSYGYCFESDNFYFIFATDDCPEGAHIEWVTPQFINLNLKDAGKRAKESGFEMQ